MKRSFLDNFVHHKGRRFIAMALPKDLERGKIGDCFDHCMVAAMHSNGKYFYCEGKAHVNGTWIHHAWLTDKDGLLAYDPTWYATDNKTGEEVPMKMVHYIGAVLDLHYVMEFVARTEYKSPLANADKDMDLAQHIYDTAT